MRPLLKAVGLFQLSSFALALGVDAMGVHDFRKVATLGPTSQLWPHLTTESFLHLFLVFGVLPHTKTAHDRNCLEQCRSVFSFAGFTLWMLVSPNVLQKLELGIGSNGSLYFERCGYTGTSFPALA